MPTNREPILVRLLEILEGVTGFQSKFRNEGVQEDRKRDCVVLLDGDEIDISPSNSRGRAGLMRPQLIRMTPELYIIIKEQRPQNADVGTRLNAYRDAVIKAISNDVQLATLLGSNGKATYRGATSDLKSGSSLSGTMRLDFEFEYWIIPSAI